MNKIVVYRFDEYAGFWLNGDLMIGGCYSEDVDPELVEHIARNINQTMNKSTAGGSRIQVIHDEYPQNPDWQWEDFEATLPLTD